METNCPKVSIIIPVYNVQEYLRKSLDSVINQTLKDIEIICIDDCSTDGSLNILKKYAQKDNRIKILEQKINQGQGVARNRGIDFATGEYIMFLDPDDWFEINACEEAYNQISKNQNDIVFFNFYFEHFDESTLISFPSISSRLKTFEKHINNPQIVLNEIEDIAIGSACIWAQIYQNSFLKKINARFSNTRTCEDNPFFFNALCNASTISILNKELYHYRIQNKNSVTYYTKHWKDVLYNKNTVYELIKKSECKNLINMYIPYYWNSITDGHFKSLKKLNKKYNNRIFNELHKLAIKLNTNHDMKQFKEKINYYHFKTCLKSKNIFEYHINTFLECIYSRYKKNKHDIILLLGLKFSIRRSNEKIKN